jgi:type II secretory pathway pseudopilin PulG
MTESINSKKNFASQEDRGSKVEMRNTSSTLAERWAWPEGSNKKSPTVLDRQEGHSLLELMIVVAMVTVITGYSVIQFGRAVELTRLDSAAARVASKLMDARMNAIKRNAQGTLSISTGSGTMRVNCPGSTPVGALEPLSPGISFASSTPATITFDSLGRLSAANQTVTLRSTAGRTKTVTVNAMGKITINNMN